MRILAFALLLTLAGCADAERLIRDTAGSFPTNTAMEPGYDRPGSDYHSFDVNNAGPTACQSACQNDGTCRAWTHTEPGLQSDGGMCWLKDAVPDRVRTSGMTSGVVSGTSTASSPVASVAGSWDTEWSDTMTLRQTGTEVTGTYDGSGTIEGTLRGNVLEGYYVGASSRQCATTRNGSRTWGRIRWVFTSNDRFEGRYSYCDEAIGESDGPWRGTRVR